MPVPPLQWINLSNLTTGSNPPPLRDSTIGYDDVTRTLMVFGGVSSQDGSFTSQQTFLLNLNTLVWSLASPSPGLPPNLSDLPPARSKAQAASDFAVNSRRSWIIWGGRGANGEALNDLWSYDFANQIWVESQFSGPSPSARWGAAGGSDLTHSLRVPNPPNFKNDLFFFGGSSASASDPFSDAWHLTLDGTLSSNVQDVQANWTRVNWPVTLTGAVGDASAVLPSGSVVAYGGCTNTSDGSSNSSCAVQDTIIFDPVTLTSVQPRPCPAPRLEASLTPNYSGASQSFISQVFLLFGSFDTKQWNSSIAIFPGEVAILDTSSSSWSRILPSGDPSSSSSVPAFPSQRLGAAVLSYPLGLVGANRQLSSDTIVFGGQSTQNGDLLNDLWILRAYNGSITGNKQTWSGFGDGRLNSGINADGRGVAVTYVESCAQRESQDTSSTTPNPSPIPTTPATSKSTTIIAISTPHKVLSPAAIALLLLCCVLHRISHGTHGKPIPLVVSVTLYALGVISIGCNVAGIAVAFSSVKRGRSDFQQRSVERLVLHSSHAVAGLVISGALYLSASIVLAYQMFMRCSMSRRLGSSSTDQSRSSSTRNPYLTGLLGLCIRNSGKEPGEGTEKHSSLTPKFEVTNRPSYVRAHSSHRLRKQDHPHSPRDLSDLGWLERQRTLSAVGESEFSLSQIERPSTRSALQLDQHPNQRVSDEAQASKYQFWESMSYFPFHTVLLTNAIFSLIALWKVGHSIPFIFFILWLVSGYSIICWTSRNQLKILNGLRTHRPVRQLHLPHADQRISTASSREEDPSYPASEQRGNSPPVPTRSTTSTGINLVDTNLRMAVPLKMSERRPEDEDEDEDDGAKQISMELEMQRRDVSIVTVPRRQLRIANA